MQLLEYWRPAKYYHATSGKIEEYPHIEVSNLGRIRYLTGKIIKPVTKYRDYPVVQPYYKSKQIRLLAHILVASSFLELPKIPNIVVDHIDRDKFNFRLTNLRFVSKSENGKNRDNRHRNDRYLIELSDDSTKIIGVEKVTFSVRANEGSELSRRNVLVCRYELYTRLIAQNNLDFLIRLHKDPEIEWKRVEKNLYICKFGIIKRTKTKIPIYSLGILNKLSYFSVDLREGPKKGRQFVHRIMAKYFLNNGKDLDENLQVDHINADPSDNRVENLKICTGKENLANINFKLKTRRTIKLVTTTGTFYFFGLSEAAKTMNSRSSSIGDWIRKGFLPTTVFGDNLLELCYCEYHEPSKNIKFEDLGLIKRKLKDWRHINSIEDINKLIQEQKIVSRTDATRRGYRSIFDKANHKGWDISKVVYYKDPDANK